jgi:putative YphP/YqiW family bacilliredoxin
VLAGETYGFEEFALGCDLAEEAGGAADAEGGVGGEENMLLDGDGGRWHGLEGTTIGRRTGASGAAGGETVQSKRDGVWPYNSSGLEIQWLKDSTVRREMLMYPEIMVIPMREELTRAGLTEARSAADVDAAIAQPGTTMVVVNSICGCAAGKMRPGVRLAMQHAAKPDHSVTVFAGQDREATEKARSYFGGHPPTSPAIAILRDGQLVYLMQRSAIETSTAPAIAQELTRAFDTYCATTTA